MALYWLIAVGVFLVVEAITLGLTTIWFAGGALIAFLANVCGAPLWIQVILFLVVSILLLIFTKPVVEKRLNNSRARTNMDQMAGKRGKVTISVNNFEQTGTVVIAGMEWTARSKEDSETIPVGSEIEVLAVEGAHVVVKKV